MSNFDILNLFWAFFIDLMAKAPFYRAALLITNSDNFIGRPLRVHLMRLLLHLVPVVLVEHGPVPGPRRADAGLQVDHRLPRPAAGGQAGQAEGPLLSVQASLKLKGTTPRAVTVARIPLRVTKHKLN